MQPPRIRRLSGDGEGGGSEGAHCCRAQDEFPRWMGSIDPESGVPSYWSFWGYDYGAQRGIGEYPGGKGLFCSTLHSCCHLCPPSRLQATTMQVTVAAGAAAHD